MHELSIAEELIDIIKEAASSHGIGKVEQISLRIGAMRQVVPDALLFAFEIVAKDTPAEGAAVSITTVPTRARCGDCGREFFVEEHCFVCGACESCNVTVIEGKELFIDSIQGE